VRVQIRSVVAGPIYDLQIRKEKYRVKANHRYIVSFRARANEPREMDVGLTRAHGDWAGLGFYANTKLTTQWQAFSFDFLTLPTADDDNACLIFNLAAAAPTVEVSTVHIRDASDGKSIDPSTEEPGVYSINYEFNSEGCRAANFSAPKTPTEKRVLLLGDSFVFGSGVPNDAVLSAKLEGLLNASGQNASIKYRVINCGQVGYGTRQARLFYELLGADYKPDLVLVGVTWKDDTSIWEELSPQPMGRFESSLFSVRALLGHWQSAPHTDFTKCVEELKLLDQAVQARGSTLGVFIFRNNGDYPGSTESGKIWNKLTSTVTEGLRTTRLSVFDTGSVLKRGDPEDLKAHAVVPQEPNEVAHAIAARELVSYLRGRGMIAQ
jgi:hypothetical protein